MNKSKRIKSIFLVFYLLIYSCNFLSDDYKSPSLPTSISALTGTDFNAPLYTSTPDYQAIITAYPTITLRPTLTPLEAEKEVINLLQSNGECKLPCFWGITPGQTSVELVHSSLHAYLSIALEDFLFSEKGGGVGIIIPETDFLLSTHLTIRNHDNLQQQDIIRWLQIDFSIYDKDSHNAIYDSLVINRYFKYYTLSNLLAIYGKPTNVYINFENDMGLHEYYLFLDYTDSGWVAMLKMPLSQEGNFFVGCPALAFTRLWLWSSEDIETAKEFGFIENINLKSIDEATSLSLNEFYNQFKKSSNTQCLISPVDIYSQ